MTLNVCNIAMDGRPSSIGVLSSVVRVKEFKESAVSENKGGALVVERSGSLGISPCLGWLEDKAK
jgi:hypothetical protein